MGKPKFSTWAKLFYVLACVLLLGQYFSSLAQIKADSTDNPGIEINDKLPVGTNGEKTIITGATVKFTDKDGKSVDPAMVTSDTNISLSYEWALPEKLTTDESIKAGDYFTFQLPEQITYASQTGTLGDYGTYTVNANGLVTFTFNQNVENKDNITGTFNYNQLIKSTTTTGDTTISIPIIDPR